MPTDTGSSDSSSAGGLDYKWREALQWDLDNLDNEETAEVGKLPLPGAVVEGGAVKGMQGMLLRAGGLVFGLGLVCPPILLL